MNRDIPQYEYQLVILLWL